MSAENGQKPVLVIRGLDGYLKNETYTLSHGESVTVGRSRSCGFSLRNSSRFQDGSHEACLEDADFLRVSREHIEISYPHPRMVEVRNLSRNGILVDGKRVDRVILTKLDAKKTRIRFGGKELLALSWQDE